MPALVLLNGPPAVGKSTLARRLVDLRPLALNLDIDVLRAHLGGWEERPSAAGVAARELAKSMAATHLSRDLDVVVPQFLGRVGFIEELAALAASVGAEFVEVVLWLDRAAAVEAFRHRSRDPTDQTHVDALALMRRSESADPIGDSWDALDELIRTRPQSLVLPVERGRIDESLDRLLSALRDRGVDL